ncbi:response regulator [bacterium]|nr:response regulator [bacterium]
MNEPKKVILIVEDDAKLAKALSIRLKAAGYEIKAAANGVAGIEVVESEPPDLIIADIFMPIGAGFAMAYRLRQTAANVPIVFITGSKDPKLRKSAKQFGAVGFIEKPYDPEKLLAVVNRALRPKVVTNRVLAAVKPAKANGRTAREKKKLKRILVVEDDRKIALSLSIRLQTAGYEVELAEDAFVGAKIIEYFQPDVLLLDITMPGGGGFKVAERVRQLLPASTAIIFMTANHQPRLRKKAAELGAAGYFEKPYDPKLLLSTINDIVDGNVTVCS